MTKEKKDLSESLLLRKRAEEQLKNKILEITIPSKNNSLQQISEADILRINNELELTRIELELQNEELRNALKKADAAVALYDLSPVGYFALKSDGSITQINKSGASMLGEDRLSLETKIFRLILLKII